MSIRSGTVLIAEERARQIADEGWTPEHDDGHDSGELALAAACYAANRPLYVRDGNYGDSAFTFEDPWPWRPEDDRRTWNPEDGAFIPKHDQARIRELVKAGALIAAEIDRLQRVSKPRRLTPADDIGGGHVGDGPEPD